MRPRAEDQFMRQQAGTRLGFAGDSAMTLCEVDRGQRCP